MSPSLMKTLTHEGAYNGICDTEAHVARPNDLDGELHESDSVVQAHPLGVKPSGNALTANENSAINMGTFGGLPDETMLVLLERLDSKSLLNLGASCRGLFAYATTDPLWKDLFIQTPREDFVWRGSWRSTYLDLRSSRLPMIDCSHVFSDALHRPYFCSQIPLLPYSQSIPTKNRIPRLSDLTIHEFANAWTDQPFILTDPVKKWPVQHRWCQEDLLERYGNVIFRAEAVDWPLKTYLDYMKSNIDESPLYLFDRGFVEKMDLDVGQEGGAYWPPECFGEDFFAVLGDQRPDHRWLIIGPERSGSTFHKDPNATSAWNAVIRGSKYWIMFPNSTSAPPPPGVFVSDDQSEVTSPLSIAEWLLTFHEEARNTPGCLEGVCGEGEVLHVPQGWWHLVVNLEPAIAITQNFVPKSHLSAAVDFLKNKPAQVSGFKSGVQDPHALFMARLQESYPNLLQRQKKTSKKRKWEEVVQAPEADKTENSGGFSFAFGSDVDNDEVP